MFKKVFGKLLSVPVRDGSKIEVKKIGTGQTYVLLVHGIGGNHMSWEPFTYPFLKDFTFIIPNLRGFGLSSEVKYNERDVLKTFAEDLSDIIDALVPSGEKVILAGLSMGAYASYKLLEIRDGKFYKYLNVDQCPKAMNSDDWKHGLVGRKQEYLFPKFLKLMKDTEPYLGTEYQNLPTHLKDFYLDCMSDFFESAFHRKIETFVIKNIIKYGIPVAVKAVYADKWESYYRCLDAYVNENYDFRNILSHIDIPVSIFVGKNSEMYPSPGQLYIADIVSNLNKTVVFDESHALMYTAPIKFVKHFKEFLYSE